MHLEHLQLVCPAKFERNPSGHFPTVAADTLIKPAVGCNFEGGGGGTLDVKFYKDNCLHNNHVDSNTFLAHLVRRTDELLGWVGIRRRSVRPSVRPSVRLGIYLCHLSLEQNMLLSLYFVHILALIEDIYDKLLVAPSTLLFVL